MTAREIVRRLIALGNEVEPHTPNWYMLNRFIREAMEVADKEEAQPFEALIERSSLGTPEAKAIRAQADPAMVNKVLERANELERSPVCLDCGHPLAEADHHAPVCPYCGVA